jgi:hypothetical protein
VPGHEILRERVARQEVIDRDRGHLGFERERGQDLGRPMPFDRVGDRAEHDERSGEGHRARPGLLAGVRADRVVGERGERAGRLVRDRDDPGRLPAVAERASHADGLGALSGLAHEDQVIFRAEHGQPEMQELGGVDHGRGDAGAGQRSHGGIAGVVGAAHPRKDQAPSPSRAERPEPVDMSGEPCRGPAQGIGLASDLGDEWVRKLS